MRQLSYGIALAIFVAPTALAAVPEETCQQKYPIPNTTINFVEEETGHNPLQFLLRRCLANERRQAAEERLEERRRMREEARSNRGLDRAQSLLGRPVPSIQRKFELLPDTRPYTLSRPDYNAARQSRRSLVRQTEGVDRINAIRRRLMSREQVDLCTEVRTIGSTSPCFNYGSYNQDQLDRRSPYLQYFK